MGKKASFGARDPWHVEQHPGHPERDNSTLYHPRFSKYKHLSNQFAGVAFKDGSIDDKNAAKMPHLFTIKISRITFWVALTVDRHISTRHCNQPQNRSHYPEIRVLDYEVLGYTDLLGDGLVHSATISSCCEYKYNQETTIARGAYQLYK